MQEEIICAGFGGQGIMLLGKVIAQAALKENKQLTWMPSYGAAMRGGTAYCMVVVSDKEVASPYVDACSTLFVFNQPSWDKFQKKLQKRALVLLNSTLVDANHAPKGIKLCLVPFTQIASSLGDVRVANMVALGKYLKEKKLFKKETVFDVFSQIAPKNKRHLIDINKKAIEKGYAA
jgi:2-oxoglutarate ferredoxin oxidoreductase subunit gamma